MVVPESQGGHMAVVGWLILTRAYYPLVAMLLATIKYVNYYLQPLIGQILSVILLAILIPY